MTMAENIRTLRIANNMTQKELAEKLGVTEGAIRKYESGAVENITRTNISIMAKLFGVRPSYLMGFEDSSVTNNSTNTNSTNSGNITIAAHTDEYEQHLIEVYRSLSVSDRAKLIQFADSLAE